MTCLTHYSGFIKIHGQNTTKAVLANNLCKINGILPINCIVH